MKETLKQYNDNDLKGLIIEAQTILQARDKQRKDEAMRQIRAIAAAHGLSIEAKKPGKKRGRPPKAGGESASNAT